jgi:hypothetical protein
MLKISAFLTLNGKMPKIGENREKRCTFVPDNRRMVYGLLFIVYSL